MGTPCRRPGTGGGAGWAGGDVGGGFGVRRGGRRRRVVLARLDDRMPALRRGHSRDDATDDEDERGGRRQRGVTPLATSYAVMDRLNGARRWVDAEPVVGQHRPQLLL